MVYEQIVIDDITVLVATKLEYNHKYIAFEFGGNSFGSKSFDISTKDNKLGLRKEKIIIFIFWNTQILNDVEPSIQFGK
jgi:hypothetical protein